MKITLWYESHNAHERLAAKCVAAKYPDARLVDVSTWTAMRDRPSESGWPDRHVRAFPCLVFDTDDGAVELERVEEFVNAKTMAPKEFEAKAHAKRVNQAIEEARLQTDVPGGARPIPIAELRGNTDVSEKVITSETPSEAAVAGTTAPAAKRRSPKSPK